MEDLVIDGAPVATETIESDDITPSNQPDPVPQPQGSVVETSSGRFDGMDIGELEEITQRIADGRIKVTPTPDPAAQVAPSPEPVAPVIEEEEEESFPQEPAAPDTTRARIRVTSDEDRAIVSLMKAQPGLTISAALAQVRQDAETAADEFDLPEETAPPVHNEAPAGLPFATTAEAEAYLEELEEQKDTATFETYDDAEAKRLAGEIRKLRKQLPAISTHEATAAAQATEAMRERYNRIYEDSESRATQIFPELAGSARDASPLFAEMSRLDKEAQAGNPELWNDPEKFLKLAIEAATRVGTKATSSPMPVPSAPSARSTASPRNPEARGVAASPTARATTPPPAISGAIEMIRNVRNADDLEDLNVRLGIR